MTCKSFIIDKLERMTDVTKDFDFWSMECVKISDRNKLEVLNKIKCIKCGNELTDFESLIMKDVPDSAYCMDCGLNHQKEKIGECKQ